jgi:hypothetical protein
MKSQSKIALAASVVSAALCTLLILSVQPPSEQRLRSLCVDRRPVLPHLSILVNCDSYEFIRLAQNPASTLSYADSFRQSRPGYAALGWTAALPFRAGEHVVKNLAHRKASSSESGKRMGPYYMGFLLINAVALVLAARIFLSLTAAESAPFFAVVPALVALLLNGVTIWFFWTPHLQIFNVLIPLVAIQQARRAAGLSGATLIANTTISGLLCGLGGLIYGAFLLIPATIAARMCFDFRKRRSVQSGAAIVCMAAAFALPLLAWRALVISHSGRFYMSETAHFHQFVWIAESLRIGVGPFLSAALSNTMLFLSTLRTVVLFPAILLALTTVIRVRRRIETSVNRELRLSIVAYYTVAVPFLWLMGFYAYRLTWLLMPPLLILLACELVALFKSARSASRPAIKVLLALAVVFYVAMMIATDQSVYVMVRA